MQKPNICRAIPKQRYKLGDYTIVVLEDIESKDGIDYEYLLAAVKDGHQEPEVYISCEKSRTETAADSHAVRVFAARLGDQASGQIIERTDRWANQDAFVAYALSGFQQMLQLQDENPVPIT